MNEFAKQHNNTYNKRRAIEMVVYNAVSVPGSFLST